MTTAQLSVGINTDQAKADLLRLRQDMATALKGVTFELPTKQLVAEFKKTIEATGPLLTKQLVGALDSAFKAERSVNINSAELTKAVRAAAQAGLAGLNLSVAAAAGGASPLGSGDVKAMVRGMITEATDEIIKNAPKLRRAAKAAADTAGPADSSQGADGFKASRSISFKNRDTGYTFRASAESPAKATREYVEQESLRERLETDALGRSLRRMRLGQELHRRSMREQAAERKRLAKELDEAMAVGPDRGQGQRLRDRGAVQEQRQASRERRELEKLEQQSSNETYRVRRRLARDAIAQEKQDAKELAAAMAVGPDRGQSQRLRDREALSEARRAAKQRVEDEKRHQQELAEAMAVGPDRGQSQRLRDRETLSEARRAAKQRVEDEKRHQQELAAAMAVGPDRGQSQRLRDREALAEARRVAREQRQAARSQDRDVASTVRFSAPQAETELARLTTQLKQLRQVQAFIEQGRADLALQKFGSAAVASVGEIANLQARVDSLRLANQALKKSADDAGAALRKQMAAAYEAAKFQAQGTALSGRGVKVSGAKALVDQFGEEKARAFLGKNDFLVNEIPKLGAFASGAKTATEHTKQMRSAMNDAHSAARGLAGSLGAMWLTWGSTAPLVASAALGLSLKSVFTIGKDVEYQLGFVAGLTGEAAISVRDFGAAMAGGMTPPREAAEGLRALAQNGLNSVQALAALPDVINLAVAGEMKLADAALGATGILAAFNLGLSNLSHVSDVFAKAAAISNTSVAGMVEAMKQASTVAGQYGVTVDQTAASLAVMAQRNIEGSAAGTALRNMISELAAPTKEAQRALKALGVDAFENGKMKDYSRLLEEVRAKTIGLNQETRVKFFEVIFNERGAKAADAIIGDLDNYKKKLREIRDESNGFTKSLTNILGDTTEGKVRKLTAEFQNLAAGALPKSKDQVDGLIMSLRNLVTDPATQTGLANLIANVAAFTRTLVDNAGLIASLGASYALYKVAILGVAPLVKLLTAEKGLNAAATVGATVATTANTGATVAATGATTAHTLSSRILTGALGLQALAARGATAAVAGLGGAVGIATGGISILVGLLATWGIGLLATRDNTNEAAAAQDNLRESTIAATREIDKQLEAVRRQARFQAEVQRLIKEGYTVEGAEAKAGEKLGKTDGARGDKEILRQQEILIEQVRQAELNAQPSPVSVETYSAALKTAALLRQKIAKDETLESESRANRETSRYNDQLKALLAFNKKLGDTAAETKKFGLLDLRIQPDQAKLNTEDFNALKAKADRALNDQLEKRTIPSSKAEAEARAAARREQKDELADMEFRRRLVETQAKLDDSAFAERMDLLKSQHQQKLVGDQEFALREAALLRQQADSRVAAIKLEQGEIEAVLKANLKVPVEGLSQRLSNSKSPSDEIRNVLSDGTFKDAPDKLLRLLERLDDLKVKAAELQGKASSAAAAAASVGLAEMTELRKKFDAIGVELMQRDLEEMIKLANSADSLVINSGRGPGASASDDLYGKGFRERVTVPTGLTGEDRAAAAERARILNEAESRRRFEADSVSRAIKDASKLGGSGAKDESLKARLEVFDRYASELRRLIGLEAEYTRELEAQKQFLSSPDAYAGGADAEAAAAAARERVRTLQDLLRQNKEQVEQRKRDRDASADKAGGLATDNFNIQRSSAYGMVSFWKEYQKAATDSAKLTENVMSQAFSTVEQTLLKFTETGKLNIGRMFSSIANDAFRLITSQSIKQLLSFGAEGLQKKLFPQGATKEAAESGFGEAAKKVAKEGLGGLDTALTRMGKSISEGTVLQDLWNLVTQTSAPLEQQSMASLTVAANGAALALQKVAATSGSSSAGGLGSLFGNLFGGGGGTVDPNVSGDLLAMFYEKGDVFGGATPFAKGSAFNPMGEVLHQPTLFQFAAGGAFRRGVAGEAGAEAVMPLRRTSSGHLGVMAQVSGGGRSAPDQVNIYNYGNDKVETQNRQGPDGEKIMDIFINRAKAEVAADISGGGPIGRAVNQATGTAPQLKRMGY